MKIAVICANGKAGRLIVKEAVSRGIDVTAVVREENQTKAKKMLKKICLILPPQIWRGLMRLSTPSASGRRTHFLSTARLLSICVIFSAELIPVF